MFFAVENLGTVPAEDISIIIDFPDEFSFLIDENDRLDVLMLHKEPQPPKRPDPFKPGLKDTMNRMSTFPHISSNLGMYDVPDVAPSNFSGPFYKSKKSTEVTYEIRNLLHNFVEELDPVEFFVTENAIGYSWEIPYSIHAANLPRPIENSLIVEVQMDIEGNEH